MKRITLLDDTNIENMQGPSRSSHVLFFTVILFFASAIFWANYAVLDEVTTGEGKVIPSTDVQIVQHLEGGIIRRIFINDGDIVKEGQPLMQIDDTSFSANYKELKRKMVNLEIVTLRLNAEIENKNFVVPKGLLENNPDLVLASKRLYGTKIKELNELQVGLVLANKELKLTRPLLENGAVSEVEIIRIERLINEIKSKILSFKSNTLSELNTAKAELNVLRETLSAEKDRLKRTIIRSPIKGIIKQVKINTIGGVIKPGMDILEIVPLDDTLLIEAKIRPADIGFIHPNQKVIVKISAFDFSIYGGLEGKVEKISADTIEDETSKKEESYYLIKVRTQKNYLGNIKDPLYIIPGMLASVDILTGEKTVLDYILKPIMKARERALRER